VRLDREYHALLICSVAQDFVSRAHDAVKELACGRVERLPHPDLDFEPHGLRQYEHMFGSSSVPTASLPESANGPRFTAGVGSRLVPTTAVEAAMGLLVGEAEGEPRPTDQEDPHPIDVQCYEPLNRVTVTERSRGDMTCLADNRRHEAGRLWLLVRNAHNE
jgi:hypothetical protein